MLNCTVQWNLTEKISWIRQKCPNPQNSTLAEYTIYLSIFTEKKTCKTVQQVRKSAGKLGMVDMKWEAYSIILGWVNVYKNLRFFNDFIIRP